MPRSSSGSTSSASMACSATTPAMPAASTTAPDSSELHGEKFLAAVSRSARARFDASMKGRTNMRNVIQLAHISLDGFMAGPDGDMSFITMNDEIADYAYPLMDTVDTAVYGRSFFLLLVSFWFGLLVCLVACAFV